MTNKYTENLSEALDEYKRGFNVFCVHPDSADDPLKTIDDIVDADGHLFKISKPSTYQIWHIDFLEKGEKVLGWSGYQSQAAARAAIRDADLIIPHNWTYEIDYKEIEVSS